jgi:hypothetical protein
MLLGNKLFFFYWQNLAKKRISNFKIQKLSDFRFFPFNRSDSPKKNSENRQISILGFLMCSQSIER